MQAGQFVGARSDFVPEGTCAWLRKLQDAVPPMPADEVRTLLQEQLGVSDLGDVFEWIDLENPLGSASIAQVHKAKLRQYNTPPSRLQQTVSAPLRAAKFLAGEHLHCQIEADPVACFELCIVAVQVCLVYRPSLSRSGSDPRTDLQGKCGGARRRPRPRWNTLWLLARRYGASRICMVLASPLSELPTLGLRWMSSRRGNRYACRRAAARRPVCALHLAVLPVITWFGRSTSRVAGLSS